MLVVLKLHRLFLKIFGVLRLILNTERNGNFFVRNFGGKNTLMNILIKEKLVEKPWGRERWFALVPGKYLGKILEIDRDQQVSMHRHDIKEETLRLVKGVVEVYGLSLDNEDFLIKTLLSGESIHIMPGEPHSFKALCDSTFFEVSTPHPEDSVRLKDYYDRPVLSTFDHPDNIADSVKDATKSR